MRNRNVITQNTQTEFLKTLIELQQAEEMIRFAEPEFFESQCLLIDSLKSKLNALIKSARTSN